MSAKEMNLPNQENVEFIKSRFLHQEWVIDPAPFLRIIKPDDLKKIAQANMKYAAQATKLESQILALRSEMFTEISRYL